MESAGAVVDGRDLIARMRASRLPPPAARRSIRLAAGVSLRELAEAFPIPVSPMTVLRWEKGQTAPRRNHAVAYRRLLDELQRAAS